MLQIRRPAGAFTLAVAAGTAMLATSTPAQAADTHYAALGDSYASGTGTRDYFEDSGTCMRGPKAYPQLWADAHSPASFDFAACSGATTDDLNADQLGVLNEQTTLVTVQIGGNDVGFAGIMGSCLIGTDDGCDSAVADSEAKARDELPGKLQATYDGIRSAAPNATVVVVGYPRINELGECDDIPGYTEAKRDRINAGADVLDEVISSQASSAGFKFADPRETFAGHGVCSGSEWINGPSTPIEESFHPNPDGHASGYLPTVESVTG